MLLVHSAVLDVDVLKAQIACKRCNRATRSRQGSVSNGWCLKRRAWAGRYVAVVGADKTLVEVRAGDSGALIARHAGTCEASSGVDAGGEGVLHTTATPRVTACQCYSSQTHAGE